MSQSERRSPSRGWLLLAALAAVAAMTPAARAVTVGEQAPAFSLEANDGAARSLEALRGEQAAVLIFFRGLW
jgi:hypothetical protein